VNLNHIIDLKGTSSSPLLDDGNTGLGTFRYEIRNVVGKGRGVVACDRIPAGSFIMRDPVERYREEDAKSLRTHPLYYHLFVDPETYRRSRDVDLLWAIGPVSIVNHADQPNCVVRWTNDAVGEWVTLVALKDISAGAELLIRYTNIDEYDVENFS
jgi:SET domain-containing protein